TGIGFETSKPLEDTAVGTHFSSIVVRCHGRVLYEGGFEIRSVVELEDGRFLYGGSLKSHLLCVDALEYLGRMFDFFERLKKSIEEIEGIDDSFCQATLGLEFCLAELKAFCEEEEKQIKTLPYDRRADVEDILLPALAGRTREVLGHYNFKIGKLIDVGKLSVTSIYHKIFERLIYPYFNSSDFVRRAYEKPLGYAGDYEMMNQIYRNGFEGVGLFGRVLHHCTATEPSAESVLYRKPYFKNFYEALRESREECDVLSIACGPAAEYQEVLAEWSQDEIDRTRVTLFDLDREALEYAQTKVLQASLKASKRANVRFLNASVKSFLLSSGESVERYDLVYSAGLFDYIDQATAKALIRKFSAILKPGGKLVIGNFSSNNPSKAFCNLLAKWQLIHRTEQEMKEWVEG